LRDVAVWRWSTRASNRVPILESIDWDVHEDERWALLGPNGSGKTTLLTVASAVEFASGGRVEILGATPGRTDMGALRERIGFVDARAGHRFAAGLDIEQVVQTGATQTIGFFPDRLGDHDRESARRLIDVLGIGRIATRRFADCSQGERKRALIARALVPRPRLLLLDEPGAGLDLHGRETLLAALEDLAQNDDHRVGLVFTTHHLEELPRTTTHALLLRDGRIVAAGPVAETLTDATLTTCFGLDVEVGRTRGRWSATSGR
jgi:iron complex transport system ATP-binding protein